MSDVFNAQTRSAVMSKVRSKGNKSTELQLIELFKAAGLTGWRRNYPVKGKPAFVFPKLRVAVFADDCFWHGHDCRNTCPAANADYWAAKRERNMRRDAEVTAMFEARGWRVLRVWECELKKKNETALIERLATYLTKIGR
jgi:DNA mismatch endonuclease (patch repair protein)